MNNRCITCLLFLFLLSPTAQSNVLYEDDYESGVKYLKGNPHPGGGQIVFLGGEIIGGKITPGDGTQDYTKFNNVILDGSVEAGGSIPGSKFSLKTQYKAGGTGWGYRGSYQLNTTIIKFPEVDTLYVRWYQKWGSSWVWPRDQQKLLKIKGEEQSQNYKINSSNYIALTKRSPNGLSNETYVYSKLDSGITPSDYRMEDSDPKTTNYPLEKNRWYCIEVMVKSNTPNQNDAEFTYWVDGGMKFFLTRTNNRGSSTLGITTIELQHVLQDIDNFPSTVDTPTWMDNVVVSESKIGCVGAAAPKSPKNSTFVVH